MPIRAKPRPVKRRMRPMLGIFGNNSCAFLEKRNNKIPIRSRIIFVAFSKDMQITNVILNTIFSFQIHKHLPRKAKHVTSPTGCVLSRDLTHFSQKHYAIMQISHQGSHIIKRRFNFTVHIIFVLNAFNR